MVSNEEQHSSELLIPLELDSSSRTQSVFELGGGEREGDKADLDCTAQDGGGSLTKKTEVPPEKGATNTVRETINNHHLIRVMKTSSTHTHTQTFELSSNSKSIADTRHLEL